MRDQLSSEWAQGYWTREKPDGTTHQGNIAQESFRAGWDACTKNIRKIIWESPECGRAITEICLLVNERGIKVEE